MAKVSAAFTSFGAKGNREDLSDSIYAIDPTATPLMNSAGRRNVSNSIFQWQTDTLRAVNLGNAREEGYQLSNRTSNPTSLLVNVTQTSTADATVSGRQEATKSAGRPSELAYQMAKAAKELKRDMEAIAISNQPRNDGDDTTPTATKTRALEHWITTNVSSGTGYAAPASATAAITDGTTRTLTKTLLDDVLQTAFSNAGEVPKTMFLAPGQKRIFSGFPNRASVAITGAPVNEIVGAADIYQSDFGNIKVVPHALMTRTRTALLINPEYVKFAFLRNFSTVDIATVGDAKTKMLMVDWGLELSNEKAMAKIADLS